MNVAAAVPPAPRADRRLTLLTVGAVVYALGTLAAAYFGIDPMVALVPAALGLTLAATHHWLLQWRILLTIIIATIVFIPMKRYTLLPGALPFQLEPYRVLIILIGTGWIATMLIDPLARFRRTGLEYPLLGFVLATFLSDAANIGRVTSIGVGDVVVKKLTFLVSFVLVVYLVASTVTRRKDLDTLLKWLVGGGALVAIMALYESRTGVNYFNQLHSVLPILHYNGPLVATDDDGRGLRAYASSEHPIALSAALVMLIPLAVYLAQRTGQKRWWGATAFLTIAVFSTVSRTGILMMLVVLITYAVLKPASLRRALPALVPLLVIVQFAVPGSLHSLRTAFFPEGGLIEQQKSGAGTHGSGRIADLGPALAEWSDTPLFGQGNGTRISDVLDPRQNAPILDNQWLGTLMETGALGVLTLGWLFFRVVGRLGRFARRDTTPHGWLLAGLAASLASFGVGMFTYDAFAFSQVGFLFFVMLGFSAAALRPEPL
jgi:hypothetical protein